MRRLRIPIAAVIVLLSASWLLATWPPIDRFGAAINTRDTEEISVGFNLLIASVLPWLLQWAGIGIAAYASCRAKLGFTRTHAWAVIAFPLVMASIWWIGLTMMLWNSDPFEAIAKITFAHLDRQFGGGSWWSGLVWDFAGPMTFPLVARGVGTLSGWNFLISGCSNALVMLWLTLFVVRSRKIEQEPLLRQMRMAVPFALIGVLPVVIHCGMRLAATWTAIGSAGP